MPLFFWDEEIAQSLGWDGGVGGWTKETSFKRVITFSKDSDINNLLVCQGNPFWFLATLSIKLHEGPEVKSFKSSKLIKQELVLLYDFKYLLPKWCHLFVIKIIISVCFNSS